MDVKYIGGDVPWTLPFGDHFYPAITETKTNNLTSTSDLDLIARRHGFEPLYSTNETESQSNMQWMNAGVLFTDNKMHSGMNEHSTTDFIDNHGHTFCYLCSINAHEHERTKPRDPSQRRKLIPYNNPKALKARSASLERPSSSLMGSVPYRFIVRTGTLKNSGTRAQVFLYMYGTEKNWTSINLQSHSNSDGFPSGSVRTICLRGPDIGQLHHLNVNLVGARSDKEWFLKEIEITNLNTSVTWLCEFNCWLPKKDEHYQHEVIPAGTRHKDISFDNLTVYILQVRTGGKAFAGTDSNIQVAIRGSTSQTRRLALTSDRANLFEQNQLDTFAIVGWDIGELTELTVESDRSQTAADWDLKEMVMWKIIPQEKKKYIIQGYFVFNSWLGKKTSSLKAKKDTYSPTEFHQRGPTCYRIDVKTGNKMNAGTDANVFIVIYGKNNRTSIHHLDNRSKNDFEKGSKCQFTIMDYDVGEIEQIKIWHDNTGVGAAWYLESVVIRKLHSTNRTVTNVYTQRLDQISQVLYKQAREQIRKQFSSSKSKESDELSSNRSILRSLMLSDKMNSQKKVRWDEQSMGSQDDPIRINTKQMRDKQNKLLEKSSQIDSGHFDHKAYWISSHTYENNKWKIDSIEEQNRFNLDESVRSTLLSDRLTSNKKFQMAGSERDDEVYEFDANRWLEKDKLEAYLTPKNKRVATERPSSSRASNELADDRDILKRMSKERPSSRASNELADDRDILKRMSKERSSPRTFNELTDDRDILNRISREPPFHQRSTASSLFDMRGKSPRLDSDEFARATMKKTESPLSSARPKSAARSTPELMRRDKVYSSAYGTIDEF